MLFKFVELNFYGLLVKYHIYLSHKQDGIWCMGKATEHLVLNGNWHLIQCRQENILPLSVYNFVGKEKCSKTQETH